MIGQTKATNNFWAHLKLVHRGVLDAFLAVNNFWKEILKALVLLADSTYSPPVHMSLSVNKSVDINSLSAAGNLLVCAQFIERTELDGGGQQIDAGLLKDNPR